MEVSDLTESLSREVARTARYAEDLASRFREQVATATDHRTLCDRLQEGPSDLIRRSAKADAWAQAAQALGRFGGTAEDRAELLTLHASGMLRRLALGADDVGNCGNPHRNAFDRSRAIGAAQGWADVESFARLAAETASEPDA